MGRKEKEIVLSLEQMLEISKLVLDIFTSVAWWQEQVAQLWKRERLSGGCIVLRINRYGIKLQRSLNHGVILAICWWRQKGKLYRSLELRATTQQTSGLNRILIQTVNENSQELFKIVVGYIRDIRLQQREKHVG